MPAGGYKQQKKHSRLRETLDYPSEGSRPAHTSTGPWSQVPDPGQGSRTKKWGALTCSPSGCGGGRPAPRCSPGWAAAGAPWASRSACAACWRPSWSRRTGRWSACTAPRCPCSPGTPARTLRVTRSTGQRPVLVGWRMLVYTALQALRPTSAHKCSSELVGSHGAN